MHDRKIGLDLNHANLVMKELGRFHASSLLFEETLAPKTIPESFDYFDELWLDPDNAAFPMFEKMMASFAEGAIKVLQPLDTYKQCVKWLSANKGNMGKFFAEGTQPGRKFNVLAHGDSWTNNILFKYNDDNIPVDMRFVDLQCSRKSSPAADIVYFFYSSLNGDTRTKHFQKMLYTYYQSFSKVLIFARRKVPFTFKELLDEVENRKIFGLVSGMMLIQGILFAEGDEIWDLDDYKRK
ncbi:hypothetical protein Avbf_07678 [Armadillidium vulgare]|nr:hypothetical protein Avbf_07678 [Armadillidium vulgare]